MFSQLRLSFRIAAQFMRRKNTRLPSFSAAVSVVGVAIGVAAFLVVVTIFNSFQKELKGILLAANPNLVVYSIPNGIPDARDYAEGLQRNHSELIERASLFQYSEALLSFGPQTATVVVRGIEGSESSVAENLVKFISPPQALSELGQGLLKPRDSLLSEEETISSDSGSGISSEEKPPLPALVLGKGLLLRLNANVGDVVTLVTSAGRPDDPLASRYQDFRVAGAMGVGLAQYDDRIAFLNFNDGVSLFGRPGWASGVEIRVREPARAVELARLLKGETHYTVLAWQEIDRGLFEQIERDGLAIKLIVLIIALVASFNIIVTLGLSVLDRSKQIAILRSTGATRGFIVRVFVAQGVTLGLLGSIVGVALGLVILRLFSGVEIGDLKAFYFLEKIPVDYDWLLIVVAITVAVGLSLLSALFPAYRATRVSPLHGIRPAQ